MIELLRSKLISKLGVFLVFTIFCLGTYRAFTRGGNDFRVFYYAWQLVLSGHGSEIYRVSIDRYLYAPGFAWLLCPLGLLPIKLSMALWCLLKGFTLFFLIYKSSQFSKNLSKTTAIGISAWGVVFLARPLLIEFEYGQVNLMILGICFWALMGHFDNKTSVFWDHLRWFALSIAALTKLFPIPLLIVPWVLKKHCEPLKLKYERHGSIFGILLTTTLPVISVGLNGLIQLFYHWREALISRGLPIETHNQSFAALLHHYLSGNPTIARLLGPQTVLLGSQLLSQEQISLLSLAWSFIAFGILLGLLLTGPKQRERDHSWIQWTAIVIGLLIIPSHLIWKPYFVFSIPLALFLMHQIYNPESKIRHLEHPRRRLIFSSIFVLFIFLGINFTGFDFVGQNWALHFEAASVFLWMHLILMITVAWV